MQRKCKRHATLLLLVGALVLGSAVGDGEAKTTTSDVLVLTDASLDEAVGKASHLLLEFYAPWCGRCQEVAPAFEEAATELKRVRSVVQLAKIDITENPKSVKRFEVASFPTFKWFVGGKLTGAKPAATDASSRQTGRYM
ncbi:thioredoxin-like protein [Baffinella frigidus]|nr:thioredoxin-like protein [Cryptophyta sp. CCMP2293]